MARVRAIGILFDIDDKSHMHIVRIYVDQPAGSLHFNLTNRL